jgi:hypothetical protein
MRPPTAYSIELRGPVGARNSASGHAQVLKDDDVLSLCLPSFADFVLWRWAIRYKSGVIRHSLSADKQEAPELCVPFVSNLKELDKV